MKKIFAVITIVLFIITLSSCKEYNNNMNINDILNLDGDNVILESKYDVYTNVKNPTYIGTYEGLNEFKFEKYVGPVILYMTPYYIETGNNKIYVHTKDIVYIYTEDGPIYYKTVGDKDFSFLFKE